MQDNFETMVRRGSNLIQNIGSKRREFVYLLEDMSHEMVRSFLRIFGVDGRLLNWFSDTRAAVTRAISPPPSPTFSSSSSSDLRKHSLRRASWSFMRNFNRNRHRPVKTSDDYFIGHACRSYEYEKMGNAGDLNSYSSGSEDGLLHYVEMNDHEPDTKEAGCQKTRVKFSPIGSEFVGEPLCSTSRAIHRHTFESENESFKEMHSALANQLKSRPCHYSKPFIQHSEAHEPVKPACSPIEETQRSKASDDHTPQYVYDHSVAVMILELEYYSGI
ncbi:unnamed protein product [Protopolystoma xenopodis]|uniref:Uncharacterized protein n=1 Tax=Protopolystoma xenopodis TaxID=117903 RepID=A0A3S5ABQ4_9PLAT|nr:unnamed protein product [Protopolystoma xenopodis]